MRQSSKAGSYRRRVRGAFLGAVGLFLGIAFVARAADPSPAGERSAAESQVFAEVAERVDALLANLGPDAMAVVRDQARRTKEKLDRIETRQADLLRRFDGATEGPAPTPVPEDGPAPPGREAGRTTPPSATPAPPAEPTPAPASTPTPRPAPRAEPLTPDERSTLVNDAVRTFGATLDEAGRRHDLEARFLLCVMNIESAFRPDAESRVGAVGLLQLMPATAAELGANPWDIRQNILAGARLIDSHLKRYGEDVALAMAAYNAGPGAVERHKGVPPYPETRAYVSRITRECGAPRPSAAAQLPVSTLEGKGSR